MSKNKLLKPLLLIFSIILLCAVLSRVFSGSETLLEYAEKNPEIAYRKKEPEQPPENMIQKETAGEMDNVKKGDSTSNDSTAPPEKNKPENHNKETASSHTEEEEEEEKEESSMDIHPQRTTYKEGFYYEPLSEEMIARITGISYPIAESEKETLAIEAINIAASKEDIQISYDDLCYVSILHYNFHGTERTGELICNKAIAQDLVEIFYELYLNEYQIEQIRLIDEYSGDDTLSMQDNNTSCFNYRVVDGTSNLSKHALGLAIDINPFFNPYVVYKNDGTTYISPQGSETYVDRSKDFAYKIDENDLCYRLFKEHGFIWGGNWNSCKDYQHFQKTLE